MLKKLRRKFVFTMMTIITVMLIVIFVLVYQFTKTDLDKESETMLRTLAQSAMQPGAPGQTADARLPYFTLQINLWGEIVVSGSMRFDLTDEAFLQELIQEVYTHEQTMGQIERYGLRYYRTSAMGNQCVAFVDISSQQATLRSLAQISVLSICVSFVLFLLISNLLARWAVKPVEKAWAQQRQFVSDASHELKTPLTVIMSSAELLQAPDCDEESRQKFTDSILTMSRHMRNLVESLLDLARADNGQVKKNFAELDFSSLTADALLPFEPVFFERGMVLESDIAQGLVLHGSEQYLRQVVEILLDNALKYSAPGVVMVQLRRQGHTCLLSVANPGEPIPQEALEKIFERFYRTDQARSRSGSFGLGLSIAKSVVTEHGGRIWAQSNPTGNCFFVQLPLE